MVSQRNCFGLTFKDAVLYAPAGSSISADGGGVVIGGREYRLGEALSSSLSAAVIRFDQVPDPSPVLVTCNPKTVAVVSEN
jgi:hypothetical protein